MVRRRVRKPKALKSSTSYAPEIGYSPSKRQRSSTRSRESHIPELPSLAKASLKDGNRFRLRANTNMLAVPIHLHPKVSAQRRASRSSSTTRWEGFCSANEITSLSPRPRSQAATLKSRGILGSVFSQGCFARCSAGKSSFPESVTSLRTASGTDIS